jgi:hypothetical protein
MPNSYDQKAFAAYLRKQAKADYNWTEFLPRADQEALLRRMGAIQKACDAALREAAHSAIVSSPCSKCFSYADEPTARQCPRCRRPIQAGSKFETAARRIEKKRDYDLKKLLDAYRQRLPRELGGKKTTFEKVMTPKRVTYDKAEAKWHKWARNHETAAARLGNVYKGQKYIREGYGYVKTGMGIASAAGGGSITLPLVAQILGAGAATAASGPGGIAILAYGVFKFVNNMGGRLIFVVEARKRWDAETGSITNRAAQAVKNAGKSKWRSYKSSRVAGVDQLTSYESTLIRDYNELRADYQRWDEHRRHLLSEANTCGADFVRLEKLCAEVAEFAKRTQNTMPPKDEKAARKLIKDTQKQVAQAYETVEKNLKDIIQRGTRTLADLDRKLAQLHTHQLEVSAERKRWFKGQDGNWTAATGIKTASPEQISSTLSLPANERWIGGDAPKGKLDEVAEQDKHHKLQRGFKEWIGRKHRWRHV